MKYLWMLPLSLACCAPNIPPPSTLENPPPCPVQISSGYSAPFHWRCEQKEINSALVWIECNFKSEQIPASRNVCIKVGYFEDPERFDTQSTKKNGGELISESRAVCAGTLTNGESTGYIAFTKENRTKLNVCGPQLQSCVMLAYEDKTGN